jgi:membrane protein implicated in regulation of membrane protease activity
MAGGAMAIKGVLPYMAVTGGILLFVGAAVFIPFTAFGLIIFVLAGMVMVFASLAMIIMGYKDLERRTEARSRLVGTR